MKQFIIFLMPLWLFSAVENAASELDVNARFSPSTIHLNEQSTLLIELKNTETIPITNMRFTNVLPDGLFVVKGTLTTNCGGVSAAYNTLISGSFIINDAIVPATKGINSGSCSINLGVAARREGIFIKKIRSTDIKGIKNGYSISNQKDTISKIIVIREK